MPRARTLSRRNRKGRGWQKKGYRSNGELYIQLKRGTYGFSRGHAVNENETIEAFVQDMLRDLAMEDGYGDLPEGWYIDFQFHRKSLEADSQELVKTLLDGGETVYAKVFDEEGEQRVYSYDQETHKSAWTYHEPGKKNVY